MRPVSLGGSVAPLPRGGATIRTLFPLTTDVLQAHRAVTVGTLLVTP